ncbi:MAG: hypothetical protein ACRC37_00375 [Lentisphaeria bacterium]
MSMEIFLASLAAETIPWLKSDETQQVFLSSRVRFTRNISGMNFPNRLNDKMKKEVFDLVVDTVKADKSNFCYGASELVNKISNVDNQFLLERHFINTNMLRENSGAGLIIADCPNQQFLNINEVDHIRIQQISAGNSLLENYESLLPVAEYLHRQLKFCYRSDIGFLSARPDSVGTGLQTSLLAHLPGLVYTKQIGRLITELGKLGILVNSFFNEGVESQSDLFVISNQSTLGESDDQIIDRINKLASQLISHEVEARSSLRKISEAVLYDLASRAFGALKYSYLMSHRELQANLSALKLGIYLGAFAKVKLDDINDFIITCQPGHLQKYAGILLNKKDMDCTRSNYLRSRLAMLTE